MKLLLLAAIIPLALASICYGHGACIFDFQRTHAFTTFTHDLQGAKTNSDAISAYKKVLDELLNAYEAKETYDRANYTLADKYNHESHKFVLKLIHENYLMTRDRLLVILKMGRDASETKKLARQQFDESDQEMNRMLSEFYTKTTDIRDLKRREIWKFWDDKLGRIAKMEDEELESEYRRLALKHREAEMHEFEVELTKRKEARESNAKIPDDPKVQITKGDKQHLLKMRRMLDKLKVPNENKIKVLDNIELDQF